MELTAGTAGDQAVMICTGNAARSVMAAAALAAQLPAWTISTAGTLVVEGQPMSWRTRAALEGVGLAAPAHRSRQVSAVELSRAGLIVALAPEHVQWVRRNHPEAAARTGTLRRLARDLPADRAPLDERVRRLGLGTIALEPWEEVLDPGGGDAEQFAACAREIVELVAALAPRLEPQRDGGAGSSSAP